MTPEQAAGLARARARAMEHVDPESEAYIADDQAYLADVLAKWLASNPGGDVAACRERALNSYAGIEAAPADVPPSPPAPITAVTNYQARAALIQAGLFDAVANGVAQLGPSSLEFQAWEYANTFVRDSQFIISMASTLGLSEGQVDALFKAASEIS